MLIRSMGYDPDTPTYMESLSSSNIVHARRSEGHPGHST